MKNKSYRVLLLIFFIAVILLIIINGTIGNFVTPKMSIYIYISLPILFIFLLTEIKESGKGEKRKVLNIICILPLVLGIIGQKGVLSTEYLNYRAESRLNSQRQSMSKVQDTVENNVTNENNENVEEQKTDEDPVEVASQSTEQAKQEENIEDSDSEQTIVNQQVNKEPDITIKDATYIKVLNSMYENLDTYVGKTVRIQGCAFRAEGMEKNQFAIGKYYMYCCAVDMTLLGFLCEYDDYESIENDKWYEVDATIQDHDYVDTYGTKIKEPIFIVNSIKEIEKPANTIVYD